MAKRTERYKDIPGLRTITMNGVRLDIVTKKAADEYLLKPEELIPLGRGKYLYVAGGFARGGFTRDKLYKAAGYDTNKIDFAVPQPWYDLPENRARRQKGDRAVWSYAGRRNTFGKPIWDSEALKRLKTRINQRLKR